MSSHLTQQRKYFFYGWRILIVILLVSGVFFRFYNLDKRIYWRDEAVTSLRISGYTWSEVIQQLYDGREIGVEDIQKYLHPNSEKSLSDTIQSLIVEDSQHTPLYYAMTRFWAQWFGSSVVVIRSLSALTSLLTFPCLYWLCLELFNSSLVGWVTIVLTSGSFFHVIYSQEAREYVFWIVIILLLNVVFLRSIRNYKNTFNWLLYTATITVGLYTFPLTELVVISHGLYVFLIAGFRLSQRVVCYIISSISGLMFFMPWIFFEVKNKTNLAATTSWLNEKGSLSLLVNMWAANVATVFFGSIKFSTTVLILILVGYSIYYVVHKAPQRVWLFVLVLILVPSLGIILPDLIFGGIRSTVNRYLIPCYLGIQLAVAYMLTKQITSNSVGSWQRKIGQFILVALVVSEFTRCIQFSQSEIASYKDDNYNIPIARIINQAKKPLLISDESSYDHIGSVLSLSYLLDSKVKFQLVKETNIPKRPNNFSHVFLYSHSQRLKEDIEKKQNRKSELVYQDNKSLWKIVF